MAADKPIKTFVVNRAKWLRGEWDNSFLLESESGRMCCLGFVGEQRGLPREVLNDTPDPAWLMEGDAGPVEGMLVTFQGEKPKLTALSDRAIAINDDDEIDDEVRERLLSDLFAEHGYAITFVDGEP